MWIARASDRSGLFQGRLAPPLAGNDARSIRTGASLTLPTSAFLANDTDPNGDTLALTAVAAATGGSVSLDPATGLVTFTPSPGFTGGASFTYTTSDGRGGLAQGAVALTVLADPVPPRNAAPIAVDDFATTPQGTPLTVSVASLLSNDTDANGDFLSLTAVGGAVGGTVSLDGSTGRVNFTPSPGFVGTASFGYAVSDGVGGTAIGNVAVNVTETAHSTATLVVDGTPNGLIDLYESHQVAFAVSGLDAGATALATFTDRTHSATAAIAQDGAFAIDLSTFDGTVSSSLGIRDAAGNIASSAGNAITVDVDAFQSLFGTVAHDASGPAGQVFELYEGLLGRAPEAAGYEFYLDALGHGTSLAQIAAGFLASPEYVGAHGPVSAESDAGFVTELYQIVLGRSADAGGLAFWQDALSRKVSRGEVAADFALSPENLAQDQGLLGAGVFAPDPVASDVARLYYAVLDRAPDADGMQFWTGLINGGLSKTAAADGFLRSPEYAAHFGTPPDALFIAELYDGATGRAPTPDEFAQGQAALASGQSRQRCPSLGRQP